MEKDEGNQPCLGLIYFRIWEMQSCENFSLFGRDFLRKSTKKVYKEFKSLSNQFKHDLESITVPTHNSHTPNSHTYSNSHTFFALTKV